MSSQPPYSITGPILHLVQSISQKIGQLEALQLTKPPVQLRRTNRIKSIQASLSIEGNTLSTEGVTALLENRRVLGPKKDIIEVQNAINAYELLHSLAPHKKSDLMRAHKALMTGLLDQPGRYRTTQVGIAKGSQVAHLAPRPHLLPALMKDLLQYTKRKDELTLIKSCVFHYELEFIHPFLDGNGRIGRLWQTLILMQEYPIMAYVPVEQIILRDQKDYYAALSTSDKEGQSTTFIEFMLGCISTSLDDLLSITNILSTYQTRIELAKEHFGNQKFSRKQYMLIHKHISPATASRDLAKAVKDKILDISGEKRMAVYQYKKSREGKK